MSPQESENEKPATIENLIEDEREIMRSLKETLKNPETSTADKIRAANAYAYHASVLSRLLVQKGASDRIDEKTLGDFIKEIEPRTARLIRTRFRFWTRKHSSTT